MSVRERLEREYGSGTMESEPATISEQAMVIPYDYWHCSRSSPNYCASYATAKVLFIDKLATTIGHAEQYDSNVSTLAD